MARKGKKIFPVPGGAPVDYKLPDRVRHVEETEAVPEEKVTLINIPQKQKGR